MLTPDALSRHDQDMPINVDDERLKSHEKCLFPSEIFKVEESQDAIHVSTVQHGQETQPTLILENQWHEAEQQDERIPVLKHVIHEDFPHFPRVASAYLY